MIRLCIICQDRPPNKEGTYCQECLNERRRERYRLDTEYRDKVKARSRRYKRQDGSSESRRKYSKEYSKTEMFSICIVRYHMKRLSSANLDKVISMLEDYRAYAFSQNHEHLEALKKEERLKAVLEDI